MQSFDQAISRSQESVLSTNRVLKNTYMLLSATLGFSAVMAMVAIAINLSYGMAIGATIGAIVMGMFVLPKTANSSKGLGVIFIVTGLLGLGLGPTIMHYMQLPNGPQVVATAFGGTAAIFLGLSGYALTTRKDFSFMGGFLMAGMMVVIVAMIAGFFFHMPAMQLAISSAVILLMSGFILFDTSRIIHGGETNYIMATFGLYLTIFNIFIHLLHLLGVMGDD